MRTSALHNRRHLLSILLIAVVSTAIYANTLKNGFVYDDRYSIVNNDLIKDFGNWLKLLTRDYFNLSGEMSYRPVVTLSYFFDYALFGMKPWGYHLINILIHAINGALVYMFIMLIMPPSTISHTLLAVNCLPLLVSLLFVTHPILTEAVNAVSFREDLLAFLFYAATLSAYLLLRSKFRQPLSPSLLYAISCLLYFLALLSKEMAATFPLIVYCYEWIYNDKKKGVGSILFNRYNMGYMAVTALYLYIRFYYFHNPQESEVITWSIMERFLTIPYLLVSYLKLTLFPVSLSVDYYLTPVKSLFSISFLLPSAILLLLLAAAFIMRRREKGIAFGIIFFIVSLIPVYNLVPIANPLAERYLYLPALGICLSIGFIIEIIKLKARNLLIWVLAVICIFFISVVNRNETWRDDYSLWSDAVRKVPNSSRPYNDIGNVFYEKGQLEDAVKQYKTAIRLKPDFLEPHNNLGMIYSEQGRFADAVMEFRTALRFNPKQMDVRFNLGNAYTRQGKLSEAVEEFKTLLKMNPNEPQYHYALGETYDKNGRSDEALEEFKAAVRLNYGFTDAHYYLGSIYLKKGLRDEARTEFETVLKLRPDFLMVRQLLDSLERNKK